MNHRDSLIRMLRQLLEDMLVLHQQGAGYYSCVPIATRYNKLLEQSGKLFEGNRDLIETFEPLEPADPKDPSEKMKVIQGMRVEIGQLVALLEATGEEAAEA
jgi:hypothetical protein